MPPFFVSCQLAQHSIFLDSSELPTRIFHGQLQWAHRCNRIPQRLPEFKATLICGIFG